MKSQEHTAADVDAFMSALASRPNDMVRNFVTESNRIEGIRRETTSGEVTATLRFLQCPTLTVGALEALVSIYQPGAKLRRQRGMDVQVGNHIAPRGGPEIEHALVDLLHQVNAVADPHETHVQYETLHPFMDGNGRSGRAIWLWQMKGHAPIGFLHQFYYQTLGASR